MGCTIRITTHECFYDAWKMCRGVYWGVSEVNYNTSSALIHMSRTGGSCPGGEAIKIRQGNSASFGNDEFICKVLNVYKSYATIEVWKTSELEPEDPDFGFGKAEITQTNIGNGLVFNIGSKIECSLRVMNTGENGKIYGAVGLGYHDKEGRIFFTGRYMIDNVEIPSGETHTWNPSIEVLHKDYAAREMTPRGSAVYFMVGHEENKNVVWDKSEYIPVELELESGYVDPTDPEGVPDDWEKPIYDPSRPWDFINDIIPEISKFIDNLIPKKEEEPEEEPIDVMPFIYIGFMGLVGYLLIKEK